MESWDQGGGFSLDATVRIAAIAAQLLPSVETSGEESTATPHRSPVRYLWAMLISRIYEAFPLTCPQCGTQMHIIAFITEASPVQQILNHIGEPAQPPRIAPARGPPRWEEEDSGAICLDEERFAGAPVAEPERDFEFDQRISW